MTHRFRTAFMAPSGFVTAAPGAGRLDAKGTETKPAKSAAQTRRLPHVSAFRMPLGAKKTAAA